MYLQVIQAQVINPQACVLGGQEYHPCSQLPWGDEVPRPQPSFPGVSLSAQICMNQRRLNSAL